MITKLITWFPVVFKQLAKQCGMPYSIAQSAVPSGLAPNGTIATGGVVTLGTALAMTYSVGIWLYFPANAVVGGSAGMYWCVMSSTTQGQVYTTFADPATGFVPSLPSGALVAATGSNSAYTQTTGAAITVLNKTMSGGALGSNGKLALDAYISNNNSAGAKTLRVALGGATIVTTSPTTNVATSIIRWIQNRGSQSRQINHPSVSVALSTGTGFTALSVDTASDSALIVTLQLATATDWQVLEQLSATVSPS